MHVQVHNEASFSHVRNVINRQSNTFRREGKGLLAPLETSDYRTLGFASNLGTEGHL